MKVLTKEETKALEDSAAVAGIPHRELMERAGRAAARYLAGRMAAIGKRVLLLCGSGNNGGDGFVIARALAEEGGRAEVALVQGMPRTTDAGHMFSLLPETIVVLDDENQWLPSLAKADLIVDAVYGIGFHGELCPALQKVFTAAMRTGAEIVSIDLPSGAFCDTAQLAAGCLHAQVTLTFSTLKPAHLHAPADAACGKVEVLSLGLPDLLLQRQPCLQYAYGREDILPLFPQRAADSNKGTFGKALCICGSYGMAGAAILAGTAALRCGAGLVQLALPASIYPIAAARLLEAVFLPLPQTENGGLSPACGEVLGPALLQASACLVGCGMGTGEGTEAVLRTVAANAHGPLVIDADGINLLAKHIDILKTARAPLLLTPHPGEMARLTGMTVAEVQRDRAGAARSFAVEHRVVLILKGHHTVIGLPDGRVFVNRTGNAGMAKGGSGDVLAGMLAALLAQGLSPEDAALAGVWLHGEAGDRCAQRFSQTAMAPHELIDELPGVYFEIERQG